MSVRCHIYHAFIVLTIPSLANAAEVVPIPADERKAILTLVNDLVRLGLPDTADSEYFVGPAFVQQQFDPAKEEPIVPVHFSRIQETVPDSTEMVYKYIVPGPHFRLADGRWLLSLKYLLSPGERHQVFTSKLEKRELASVLQYASTAHPFRPNAEYDDWFKKLKAENLDAIKIGVKQGVPLWQYLHLPRNNTTLGVCFLLRAGVKEADLLCYTIVDTRCRDFWRTQPRSGTAGPFDPTEQYEGIDQLEKDWDDQHKTYEVERLSVAFRRDLHRYFFHILAQEDGPYSSELAAAFARATLDENDPQLRAEKISELLTRTSLPHEPDADAKLDAILQSWGKREQKMVVTNSSTDGNLGITTEFENVSSVFSPTRRHLPELFALLDDSRPTRWIDYQGSRCVGENALRAIALVLEENPLDLVHHNAMAPWTKQARRNANRNLRKWWDENQAKYMSSQPTSK